jgi:thiosulfate/3-mercaptopyruvate sulfurtransferase
MFRLDWVRRCVFIALVLVAACGNKNASTVTQKAAATTPPDTTATAAADIPTLQPAELADLLEKADQKPLLLHVGFKKLYQQAHIPGSEYFGPTSGADGVARLTQRLANTPKSTPIIIYCGCCPWIRCPNVKPAYRALHDLGFTNARVLLVTKDFGTDWADKGYPVAAGD